MLVGCALAAALGLAALSAGPGSFGGARRVLLLDEAANDGRDVDGATDKVEACGVACLRDTLRASAAKLNVVHKVRTALVKPPAPAPAPADTAVVPAPVQVTSEASSSSSSLPSSSSSAAAAAAPERYGGVAAIQARQGTILFTHIRRAGGTTLEDYILKPFVKSTKRKAYLCKEGTLARHYRMTAHQLATFKGPVISAALVWRHCPFGLHEIMPKEAPHVYITVIRSPLVRMLSWFAYCDKYSPNKCHAGGDFANKGPPGASKASKFYQARKALYDKAGKDVLRKVTSFETFHPNVLEYALDDNYQTRMICGPDAHDHAVPIGAEHLACALRNLDRHYAVVGITERYEETSCVLSQSLKIPLPRFKNDKATTGSKRSQLPSDFVDKWKHYAALDEVLYDYANARLDEDSIRHSQCTQTDHAATVVAARLDGFRAMMQ